MDSPERKSVFAFVPLKDEQRDALILDMHAKVAAMSVQLEALPDHEQRIRELEAGSNRYQGGKTVLMAGIALMFSVAAAIAAFIH